MWVSCRHDAGPFTSSQHKGAWTLNLIRSIRADDWSELTKQIWFIKSYFWRVWNCALSDTLNLDKIITFRLNKSSRISLCHKRWKRADNKNLKMMKINWIYFTPRHWRRQFCGPLSGREFKRFEECNKKKYLMRLWDDKRQLPANIDKCLILWEGEKDEADVWLTKKGVNVRKY